MANLYSVDIPEAFYHPANPAGAFMDQMDKERQRREEQRRYEDQQRRQQEATAYARQRDAQGDARDAESRRQEAIAKLAGLVDTGRVPEAQALAAAHGLPFNRGGTSFDPVPDQAPQLQMPGGPQPGSPPASFRLPGMQLRAPEGMEEEQPPGPLKVPGLNMRMPGAAPAPEDQDPAGPDLGGFKRAFLGGKRPPAPNMAGLANTPEQLTTTTRNPTMTVGDQEIALDPNGAASRADQVSDRTIRQQESVRAASEQLIRDRQEAADARRFGHQDAMQEDRQGAAADQIKLRAKLKGAGGGGAAGPGGQPSRQERQLYEREVNNWRTGVDFKSLVGASKALRAASANLEAEGPNAVVQHKDGAIQMARVFRGNTPTEGEMHYVYGGLGKTFGNALPQLLEKWSTGDMSDLELQNIRASVKSAHEEYLQNAAMTMKSARTNLGTDASTYKRQKAKSLFQSIGIPDDQIDAALGGGAAGQDPNVKVIGKKTYRKINGEWHEE